MNVCGCVDVCGRVRERCLCGVCVTLVWGVGVMFVWCLCGGCVVVVWWLCDGCVMVILFCQAHTCLRGAMPLYLNCTDI